MFILERIMMGMMWTMWVWVITAEMIVDEYHKLIYGEEEER